jgi:predicted transcriptional regulator/lambda repressor-like predicted transcriptional regulator
MALTVDETKEILELRARSYSYRKIADKTGHSENTIRKVLMQAVEQAKGLAAKGLKTDQIASQLGYPSLFVSNVIEQRQTRQKKVTKIDTDESSPLRKPDVTVEWEAFRKEQKLAGDKGLLREKVHALTSELAHLESEAEKVGIADKVWHRRKHPLEDALANFVAQQIDKIDSGESLPALEDVISNIEKRIKSISKEYKRKIEEALERIQHEEKRRSDQLLGQHIDIPLFPDFVIDCIKNHFIVKDDKTASVVMDAMHHYSVLIVEKYKKDPGQTQKMWRDFINLVELGGWAYLNRLAKEGREHQEKLLVSINVCPQCESKLTRSLEQGEEIATCSSCGVSYVILKKKATI